MSRPIYLMVKPTHFTVSYEINPWMKPTVWSIDPASHHRRAEAGWCQVRNELEEAGARVYAMPGVPGQPDLVFPANAAVVLGGKAVLARFRHPERRGEEGHFGAAFDALIARGVLEEAVFIDGCYQEGAGDCIWDANRRLFWAASGPRSTPESVAQLGRHFGKAMVHMPLATEILSPRHLFLPLKWRRDPLLPASPFRDRPERIVRTHELRSADRS